MDHKGRLKLIAETLLTGDGLAVSQRIVEFMVGEARLDEKDGSADRLESLMMLRRELRKLGEKDGAS